jgi:hypothetical protein
MAITNASSGSLSRVLFLDEVQGTVNNALGDSLFAAFHDHVHELGQLDVTEFWDPAGFHV